MNPDAITVAKEGDIIEFERNNMILQGKVVSILENSVIVNLQYMPQFENLDLEHSKTVVAHRNYTIIEEQ
jgi:uncharacterized protein YkvS